MTDGEKLETLALVLREFIGEVGARHSLPHAYIVEWNQRLDTAFPRYVCGGCNQPIVTGQSMVGSDVFGLYAHKACEKKAQDRWREANPPPAELESGALEAPDGETQETGEAQGE